MNTSAPHDRYREAEQTDEFAVLRRRFRRFAFPMTAAFLVWYFTYVLLSVYAVEFMTIKVFGNFTIGLLISFGQFVSTFLITGVYIRHANKNLDPVAAQLRSRIEEDAA